jgi:molecular chaperone GrpE
MSQRHVMSETDLHQESANDRVDSVEASEANRAGVKEAERTRRALAEEQQRNLRLRADLDNVRRRAAKEQESAERGGRRAALLPLLPVFDSLERALATGSTDQHFYEGVAATLRLFTDALLQAGAEPFDSVGLPFDPAIHEAVDLVHADGVETGTVTRQLMSGWRLGDELLRPARVIVAA